jgi:hypothetical protein
VLPGTTVPGYGASDAGVGGSGYGTLPGDTGSRSNTVVPPGGGSVLDGGTGRF